MLAAAVGRAESCGVCMNAIAPVKLQLLSPARYAPLVGTRQKVPQALIPQEPMGVADRKSASSLETCMGCYLTFAIHVYAAALPLPVHERW